MSGTVYAQSVVDWLHILEEMRESGVVIYSRRMREGNVVGCIARTMQAVLQTLGITDITRLGSMRRMKTRKHVINIGAIPATEERAVWACTESDLSRGLPPKHVLMLHWDMRAVLEACDRGARCTWFPIMWCTPPERPLRPVAPSDAMSLTRTAFVGNLVAGGRRRGVEALEARGIEVFHVTATPVPDVTRLLDEQHVAFAVELPWSRTKKRISPGRFSTNCSSGVPLASADALDGTFDSEWLRVMPPIHYLDKVPSREEYAHIRERHLRWWAWHDGIDFNAYLRDMMFAAHLELLKM